MFDKSENYCKWTCYAEFSVVMRVSIKSNANHAILIIMYNIAEVAFDQTFEHGLEKITELAKLGSWVKQIIEIAFFVKALCQ